MRFVSLAKSYAVSLTKMISLEVVLVNSVIDSHRVAWLLPVAGTYWQPILSKFTQLFPKTTVFTGLWPGFIRGFEDSFRVKEVGKRKVLEIAGESKRTGYGASFTYLSPKIIGELIRFKPDVIFSNAFSLWTIIALLLKPWHRWRIIIICDGSSPGVNYQGSRFRLFLRRVIARFTDAFITNTQAGKDYLTKFVAAREDSIFARPYLIPDMKALCQGFEESKLKGLQLSHPVFLFAGGIMPRKGLHKLIEACLILQTQGYQDYTLLIVGDGQHQEYDAFIEKHNLENKVKFLGHVEYGNLGAYYQRIDVFILPTLEDVWGMVVVEAMAFGKPVLCSKWAGGVELLADGENGYVFDPHDSEKLAELMSRFMNNPDLLNRMGEKSRQIMANHTPEAVSKFLAEVVEYVLNDSEETVA